MALSSLLHNRLRQTLMADGPFDSNDELRGVFADPRLIQWRHSLPEASNRASRVNFTIAKLLDDWNADGDNALYLFLYVLGEQTENLAFVELTKEIRAATLQDKITACEQELKQIAEHLARGWSDPAYAASRKEKVTAELQQWKARKADEAELQQWEENLRVTVTQRAAQVQANGGRAVAGMSATTISVAKEETYTDLEIHIAPRDVSTSLYAVVAELDGERRYNGTLQMGAPERERLFAKTDPAEYGTALFDALFQHDIRIAYEVARAKAPDGRLRLRLWIDHEAADLHALVWERLHYRREGGTFRVATDAKLPFSRYFGLQQDEASAIAGPVRMLCVVANPKNLADFQVASLDVEAEIANLQDALGGLRQAGVAITFMPGQTGLSAALIDALKKNGYEILSGPASLNHIQQQLSYAPGYHIVHFVGHGTFSERRDQAALILEDDTGQAQIVKDDDLAGRLAGLDHKPHLIFLAACQSAARAAGNANPFVGLAPRLVQIGIPAVVAMQDKIAIGAAQTLTQHFYRFLLQHGIVDKALNQARGFLVDTPDWATPVLFMRLREGQLLQRNSSISIAVPAPNPTAPAPQPAAESEVTSLFGGASPLEMAKRILETLECQAAAYTALTIPAHLQIELEEQRKKVAALMVAQ